MIKSKEELRNIPSYEVVMEENIEELKSFGIVLKHKKTNANIILLSNEDENKVFSIGFRTPPEDNTGVPHIIEHSVLCGSKEFPVKDPFVELVKGSLNTFLNAMTYPDKTIYPIASCNEKDFQNLMHVYLDAVFYPNIYNKEEIFKQEGWHYELERIEDEITYNGVVYNEMKGAFSSPEQQLYRLVQQSVFPDTAYHTESGGDPKEIPNLTYEQFLKFHKTYYHPSNSYIYLYGDMDMEEKLNWLDKQYLSKFETEPVDSAISLQKTFSERVEVTDYYSITEGEDIKDKTYLAYTCVIGTSLDERLYLAFQILEHALLDAPGAPLKQALLDAGIGDDILSSYDNGIYQPIFSIIAKNSEEEKKEQFLSVLKQTIQQFVQNGIEKQALHAALNYFEFKYREADFGIYPKGLMYGIQILDSWLYDEKQPFIHIHANHTFAWLKEQIETNYFEQLLQTYFLDNTHASLVILKPKVGLTEEIDKNVKEQLKAYKESLSKEQLEQLVKNTKALKAYQEEPSPKEELEKIPLLKISDIKMEIEPIINEKRVYEDTNILFHDIYTNGIGYVTLLFNVDHLPMELVPYTSLLSAILGYISTKHYSLTELSNEINIHTGGITTNIQTYALNGQLDAYTAKFTVKTKALYEELPKAFELIEELLFHSNLEEEKRLQEIIAEGKSRLQMRLTSQGHTTAMGRAVSYYSQAGYYDDLTDGIGYYRFIEDLSSHFEERKDTLISKLKELISLIFTKDVLVSFTADEAGYDKLKLPVAKFSMSLKEFAPKKKLEKAALLQKNEGFKTSGQVQYVARAGNFIQAGYPYTGAMKILKVILSYDYLWNNIRVKGGAYGCMSGFTRDGNGYFVSYRDPNLAKTNEVYEHTAQYIESFEVDERDMTKYIIGTISNLDTPLTPSAKGSRSLTAYICHITEEELKKERGEILHATKESIRNLAPAVRSIMDSKNICVIGNETLIEENKSLFKIVEKLI